MANSGEQPELLKLQVAKKTYVFTISRRFAYIKRYNVLKRLQETKENPYARKIRLAVYNLIGRKEEG